MKLILREKSCITEQQNLESLYTFKNFPLFMGCVNDDSSEDVNEDMDWEICIDTGVIQLKKLIPLEILYKNDHSSGVIGKLWQEHHESFSRFIEKYSPKSIFEIGGAHGILSSIYMNSISCEWEILEPNPSPIKECKANFISGFFNSEFNFRKNYDAIIHSHVFEHIYNPSHFLKDLSNKMDLGQKMIFSVPNMLEMLKRKYTNCLNFEHTVFLREEHIEYLLISNGFEIIEKSYFKVDHSIFYCVEKSENTQVPTFNNYYEENKFIFNDFVNHYNGLIKNYHNQIESMNKKVFLFGAHIFSQFLLKFGLSEKLIISILDNDSTKQEKRLYGTNLLVKSPQILKNIDSPTIILNAGVYNEEIKNDILKNINSSCKFL